MECDKNSRSLVAGWGPSFLLLFIFVASTIPYGMSAFFLKGNHALVVQLMAQLSLAGFALYQLKCKGYQKVLSVGYQWVSWRLNLMVVLGALLSMLLTVSLGALRYRFFSPPAIPAHFSAGMMLVLITALATPVSEELFFRAFGIPYVMEKTNLKRALFLTSLVFAILHGPFKMLDCFLFGLFSAWLMVRTRSLQPSLLLHMLVNGTAVAAILLSSKSSPPMAFHGFPDWVSLLVLPLALLIYFFFRWVKKQVDAEYPHTAQVFQEKREA